MKADNFDVIVLGVGGMGSSALYHLARRGLRVCGIEQFGIAHDRGSSHGETRIIRKAYFEHPDYVPLLHRAYELWRELEERSGEKLFEQCGFLTAGSADSPTIQGLEACYQAHRLPHERLSWAEARRRFPQFHLDPETVVFFDPLGGYLRVEECVRRHIEQARLAGASLLTDERVEAWRATGEGVSVSTDRRRLSAGKLIITAGAWAAPELRSLGVEVRILRKVLFWYGSPDLAAYNQHDFPTFYVETDYGHFYGFPVIDVLGLKVAEHMGEEEEADPSALERRLLPADETPALQFLADVFPDMEPQRTRYGVCMYTVTADRHFIVDLHTQHAHVVIGAGFSGHGFKFAPVVGEALAELAIDGHSRQPIGFLGLSRFFA